MVHHQVNEVGGEDEEVVGLELAEVEAVFQMQTCEMSFGA